MGLHGMQTYILQNCDSFTEEVTFFVFPQGITVHYSDGHIQAPPCACCYVLLGNSDMLCSRYIQIINYSIDRQNSLSFLELYNKYLYSKRMVLSTLVVLSISTLR